MAIRAVLEDPDPRLRERSLPVGPLSAEVHALIADLVQTMRYGPRPAIGLAAPQLGALVRIFVMDEPRDDGRSKLWVCINPEITSRSGKTSIREGCLSFPEKGYVRVARAERIVLRFLDRKGVRQEKTVQGLYSVCAQHELDHLDGKLMTDYGALEITRDPE